MAKRGSDSPGTSSVKKKKYAAKYKPEWTTDLQFICHSDKRRRLHTVECAIRT